MATWTDDDFRVLFAYLADVRAVLRHSNPIANDVRRLLVDEGDEAARRLARIAEAVGSSHA